MSADLHVWGRGDATVTLTFHQGEHKPKIGRGRHPAMGTAVASSSRQGHVALHYSKHVLRAGKKTSRARAARAKRSPSQPASTTEWINACKTGAPPTTVTSSTRAGSRSESLGNVAFRAGKKLTWDAAKMKADRRKPTIFCGANYRKG